MKRKILSIGIAAAMTAAVLPNAAMADSTVFDEYLYYNDFSENMDGLEIVKNVQSDTVTVEDGKLVINNTTAWKSWIDLAVSDSEGWEEFSVGVSAEILGKQNYFAIYPYAGDTANYYLELTDQNGIYRDNIVNKAIQAWGNNLRFKVDANKASSTLYAYPTNLWESSGDMETVRSATHTTTAGGVMFSGMWGTEPIKIDEIAITDLRAKAALTSSADALKAGDTLTVKFSEAMDTETFTADNFCFTDGVNSLNAAAVTANGADEAIVTVPATVDAGHAYTLVAKKEIKDADGDRLNNDKKFSVKTADADMFVVSSIPEAGAEMAPDSKITLNFNKAIDFSAAPSITLKDADDTEIPCSIDESASADKTLVVVPGKLLKNGKAYTLTVSGVKNTDGALCDVFTLAFTTKQAASSENYLYYNDFSENMNGLEVLNNVKDDTISVENGKLKITQQSTAFQSFVQLYMTGSEDWEEYSLEATAQITGKPGFIFFRPKGAKEATNAETEEAHQFMINTTGLVRNKTNNGDIQSWGDRPIMKMKLNVDGNKSDFLMAPYSTWESSGYLESYSNVEHASNAGGLNIDAIWGADTVYIDEIKVIDLRAQAEAYNTKDLLPGDVITVRFSENMTPSAMSADNVVFENNGTEIPVIVTNNGSDEMYITVPDEVLSNEEYTLTVKKEITDTDGDRLNNDKKFTVTTKKSNFNVISVTPENGAVNVYALTDITITFDNPIDYTAADDVNISVTGSDESSIGAKINLAQSTKNTMFIELSGELEPGVTYTVSISGVKSEAQDTMLGAKKFSFTVAEKSADYLYVNDFSDPSTLSDFTITQKSGTESAQITDGRLVLETGNSVSGSDMTAYDLGLFINGSENWSDYEVEMEVSANTQYKFPYVKLRGETLTALLQPLSSTLTFGMTSFDNVVKGETYAQTFNNKMHKLVIRAEGNHFTLSYDGEKIMDGEGSDIAAKGGISIGAQWVGCALVDNIKVKDLGISCRVENPKNLSEGDEVRIVFDREMNTDTFISEYVTVADTNGKTLNVSVREQDSKTMLVKFPYGLASDEKYIITLSNEIASKSGIGLSAEKSFEIKSVEKDLHVGNLKLISNGSEITKLSANQEIAASAYVKNSKTQGANAVLVMAVYDADGRCVAIKTAGGEIDAKEDKTLTTEGYTLPANVKGYSVRIMTVDSLDTIMPLVTSRVY